MGLSNNLIEPLIGEVHVRLEDQILTYSDACELAHRILDAAKVAEQRRLAELNLEADRQLDGLWND